MEGMASPEEIIRILGFEPHPEEGGHLRETDEGRRT